MLALLPIVWTKVRGWVLAAAVAAATLITIYLSGRRAGRQAADLEEAKHDADIARQQQRDTIARMEARNEVEADIASRPPGTALDRLRRNWARNRTDD